MERLEKEKVMEAALFMSPKPVSLEELNAIAEVNSRVETKAMMDELMGFYRSRKSAMEIVELPIGYQMRVREGYEEKVKHFAQDAMFHKGIMKTLALIAYKQPITQSVVIQYRNNKAYDHIKALLENGFVKKEPRGKTYVLTTTTKFLEYFGRDFGKSKKSTPIVQISSDAKRAVEKEVNKVMEQGAERGEKGRPEDLMSK